MFASGLCYRGDNCLITNDNNDHLAANGTQPGQQYTVDEQCKLIIDQDSVLARVSVCHILVSCEFIAYT